MTASRSPFFTLCADVEVPVQQVAVGAGVDGRIGKGSHIAGEHKGINGRARFGRGKRDGWRGQGIGALGQSGVCVHAAQDADNREHAQDEQNHGHARQCLSRRDGALLGCGIVAVNRSRIRAEL